MSALYMFSAVSAAPSSAPPPGDPQMTMQPDDDDDGQVGSECQVAGGVCRKSACRAGETSVPLDCGHDLGCCLAR